LLISTIKKAKHRCAGANFGRDTVDLDGRRGVAAQKATGMRRQLAAVEADHAALGALREEPEHFLLAAPATDWGEAVARRRPPKIRDGSGSSRMSWPTSSGCLPNRNTRPSRGCQARTREPHSEEDYDGKRSATRKPRSQEAEKGKAQGRGDRAGVVRAHSPEIDVGAGRSRQEEAFIAALTSAV
jgi:hypothetical protein